MASLRWDHTVHYVNDLVAVVKQFEEKGLIAFPGGSHKQWGTYNTLAYFDLSYIEFLGVENRKLAEEVDVPNDVVKDAVKLLPDHEIMSRVALRTDDIEEIASKLEAFDLDVSPIMDGKRLDVQGNLIEWRMLTIAGDFMGLLYPFVIEWKGTDKERREKLIETGIIQRHPAGDISIEQAVFYVENPEAVSAHWATIFGLGISKENNQAKLNIGEQSFAFLKGEENRMRQIVFNVNSSILKAQHIIIGNGKYIFKK